MSMNRENTDLEGVRKAEKELGIAFVGGAADDVESDDFAMFTSEGNALVADLVRNTVSAVTVEGMSEQHAYEYLVRGTVNISKVHPEVHDTMVRETVAYALDAAWEKAFGHKIDQWQL